jgi:apolipoprotein N-acyltransferase
MYLLQLHPASPKPLSRFISKRSALTIIAAAAGMTIVFLGYSWLNIKAPGSSKSLRVSVLQGNIDQEKKSNPRKYAKEIMQTYIDLTKAVADQEPELIVWPEAATPGFVLKNMAHMNKIVPLIREMEAYFLIGSSEYPKFQKGLEFDKEKYGNTALFFSPKGKVLGQYLKIHLVPFGETIPYEGIIPWPSFIVSKEKQSFEIPGKEYTLFNLENNQFGALICWEVVFPDLFRTFVKNGAGFMLNITNEGWFGDTAAPHQMLAINVFRAIENRIVLARAANTGISCFIDPTGHIYGIVEDQNGKATYVRGHLTRDVNIYSKKTFYTCYGDVFVYIVLAIVGLFVTTAIIRPRTLSYHS